MTPTRVPTGWWEWARACQELASSDGAHRTAMVWGTWCATWRQSGQITGAALTLEELAQARRAGPSTVRRHLQELVAAGLLARVRAHSRHGPDVYEARVPEGFGRAEQCSVPASGDPEQRSMPGGVDSEQCSTPGGADPEQCSIPSATLLDPGHAPFSPDSPEPPSRAGARAPAPARGRATAGGGSSSATPQAQDAAAVVDQLLAGVPPARQHLVTAGWRLKLQPPVGALLAAGWSPADLISDLVPGRGTERHYRGVSSPCAALTRWATDLLESPSPSQQRARAAEATQAAKEAAEKAAAEARNQAAVRAADQEAPWAALTPDEQQHWIEKATGAVTAWRAKPRGEQRERVIAGQARHMYLASIGPEQ